ncbi:hypothetical protein PAMC26510_31095 [Caballeronia sordidicola]|uniref:Uncharacterized protein n=1 Tax=Caballeronia sordidicola TaxID=196367 RepID=A0A242M905_CABSO|nr:hypothetical protein PAMC26510_31095 [Caballeronia sordidicola]
MHSSFPRFVERRFIRLWNYRAETVPAANIVNAVHVFA